MAQVIRNIDLNVIDLAANINAVIEAAEPRDWAEGADWYPAARRAISDLAEASNKPYRLVAGVVAVLSPQLRWSINIKAAEYALRYEKMAGVLGTSFRKAIRIVDGEEPSDVIGGPKVTAFFANLTGDDTAVTVDTHAINVACGGTLVINKNTFGPARYAIFAEAYRIIAEYLGRAASEVQAVAWVTWRRLFYTRNDARLHPALNVVQ